MAASKTVAIIIPHFGEWSVTEHCLAAVQASRFDSLKIWVIDNTSTVSGASLRAACPQAQLISPQENCGFAGGVNAGCQAALKDPAIDWIVVLNNDVVIEKYLISRLIDCAQKNNYDMVAPRIMDADSKGVIDRLGIVVTSSLSAFDRKDSQSPIMCPSGCCALYSRRLLESVECDGQFFDEDFFMYYEDTDLGWRARLYGFTAGYSNEAVAYHKPAASISVSQRYFIQRNVLWCIIKNVPGVLLWRYMHWIVAYQLLTAATYLIRGQFGVWVVAKWHALSRLPAMLKKRRAIQRGRRITTVEIRRLLDSRPFYTFKPRLVP